MKCIWCNKPCDSKITVQDGEEAYACCSEECNRRAEKFLRFAKRFTPLFLGLIIISTIALLALSVTAPRLASLPVAAMGCVILFLPFCTPQTVQALGLKKSILIGRIMGILVMVLGFLFYFLMQK